MMYDVLLCEPLSHMMTTVTRTPFVMVNIMLTKALLGMMYCSDDNVILANVVIMTMLFLDRQPLLLEMYTRSFC
jgi:hypothetical protein